jgi:hypothetical protein
LIAYASPGKAVDSQAGEQVATVSCTLVDMIRENSEQHQPWEFRL